MAEFQAYFDVADEIYLTMEDGLPQDKPGPLDRGCTLYDLDQDFIDEAKAWADQNGAPWPPYLPWAEETQLDIINGRRSGLA